MITKFIVVLFARGLSCDYYCSLVASAVWLRCDSVFVTLVVCLRSCVCVCVWLQTKNAKVIWICCNTIHQIQNEPKHEYIQLKCVCVIECVALLYWKLTKTTMQLCVQNNICCSWNKPLQSIQYFLTYESINYWLSRRARLPQSTQFNCQWFNFKIVVFPLFSLLCALYSNSSIFKFPFFHIFRILCLLSLLPSICFKLLVSFRVIIKFL